MDFTQGDFTWIPKGFKRLTLGGEVRLRYAYVITCHEVVRDSSGNLSNCYAHMIIGLGQELHRRAINVLKVSYSGSLIEALLLADILDCTIVCSQPLHLVKTMRMEIF